MNDVFIIYGNQADDMVPRLLEKSRSLEACRPDDRIFIKPNLVVSRKNWAGLNTDPLVVEALVKAIVERGCRHITVGDGSGMGNSATRAFEYCGYREMARRYGLTLVDVEKDGFVTLPTVTPGPFREIAVARKIIESDVFINVPVLKAHSQTRVTCSLKNLKGAMPRSLKTGFHAVDLEQAIAQLNGILKPDLILVDGLQGDLSSETGSDPVRMDRMLLGTNPVAVDSVAAQMLGYAPEDIRHIALSAAAGLGGMAPHAIRRRPLNRPTTPETFTPPPHFSERFPCAIDMRGACCTCSGNLVFALERLNSRGMLTTEMQFLAGAKAAPDTTGAGPVIAVGRCVPEHIGIDRHVRTCPPDTGDIIRAVEQETAKGR